jgi:hypothetical protein
LGLWQFIVLTHGYVLVKINLIGELMIFNMLLSAFMSFATPSIKSCAMSHGYQLSFSKQECQEEINRQLEVQGCYAFELRHQGEVVVRDEAARLLSIDEENAEGSEYYVSFYVNQAPDLKRAFGISIVDRTAFYLDPSLFNGELLGQCQ